MSSVVAPGPYIGDLSPELSKQNPTELLQNARTSLESVSAFKKAADFLRGQIESLATNTVSTIEHIPNFRELHNGEIALSQLNDKDTSKLLEVIKSIRQAFSLQRLLHQTREITPIEQMNFAKLLNQRIDPIDKDGIRTKEKKAPDKFQIFKVTMSGLAAFILQAPTKVLMGVSEELKKLKSKFWETGDVNKVVNALYVKLREQSNGLLSMLRSQAPVDTRQTLEPVFSSMVGGLDNAISTHLAFVKVAFAKLKQMIPDQNNATFKSAWNNVLKNLSHISKQFASVQAMTLKLVENLNGSVSNQGRAYDFNAENFELVFNNGEMILLPTLKFLQTVITKANDNATVVRSKGGQFVSPTDNFAESYYSPNGCPIFGVKGINNGEQFKLDERYFEVMDLITKSVFEDSANSSQ